MPVDAAPTSSVVSKPRPTRRRWLIALVIAGVVVVAVESVPDVPGHDQAALAAELVSSDAAGAIATISPFQGVAPPRTCSELQARFGMGNHLFTNSSVGWYASIWPSYQALLALETTSLHAGDASCATAFVDDVRAIDANYWDQSLSPFPPAFDQGPNPLHFRSDLPRVDDSLWMALAVMDAYAKTDDPALLGRAEAVFALAVSNWDPRRGGIFWEDHAKGAANDYKAVVSNAPAVLLGVELFSLTGRRSYLTRSEQIFTWLGQNLRDPATGLYADGVRDDRRPAAINKVEFTYNQGIVLGAMVALSKVDPRRYPLIDALHFAETCMAYFGAHRSYGQPGFDAIWAENLLWSAGVADEPGYTRAARTAVAAALRAAPKNRSDLLDVGSEMVLGDLATLDTSSYRNLEPAMAPRR